MKKRRTITILAVLALTLAACTGEGTETTATMEETTTTSEAMETTTSEQVEETTTTEQMEEIANQYLELQVAGEFMPQIAANLSGAIVAQMGLEGAIDSPAAALREDLTYLLREHTTVTALATGAALRGDTAEFEQAAEALANNTDGLVAAVESVYGAEGATQFRTLWEDHIGMFVAYTQAAAGGDQAGQDQALSDLAGYATDFGAFIETATEGNLSADAVIEAASVHVETLIAVIDAQAAGDSQAAAQALDPAVEHMNAIALNLATAIDAQMDLEGAVDSPAAELNNTLSSLLMSHTYYTGFATDAALEGRSDAFSAYEALLATNTDGLVAAVESVYGAEGAGQFRTLWEDHIGMFVAYTQGVGASDEAAKDQAISDLAGYATDFGAFIETATEGNLPADAVAEAAGQHVDTFTAAIDAQGADAMSG